MSASESIGRATAVGGTRDAGYQIGVSRTLPFPPEAVWEFITGPDGIALWLGRSTGGLAGRGERYETHEGVAGEVRSRRERDRIRLTWRPHDWDHETTVQITVSAGAGGKAVLRFHQERLSGPAERSRKREHWRAVMAAVEAALGEPTRG